MATETTVSDACFKTVCPLSFSHQQAAMRFAVTTVLPLPKRQLPFSSLEVLHVWIFLLAPDLRFVQFGKNLAISLGKNFLAWKLSFGFTPPLEKATGLQVKRRLLGACINLKVVCLPSQKAVDKFLGFNFIGRRIGFPLYRTMDLVKRSLSCCWYLSLSAFCTLLKKKKRSS